jgi:hypothetical protein
LAASNAHPVIVAAKLEPETKNSGGMNNCSGYEKTRQALVDVFADHIKRQLPLRRLVQLATLMSMADIHPSSSLMASLIDRIELEQHEDGGWVDCEDTAWATAVLAVARPDKQKLRQAALNWLDKERIDNAWGYCKRDKPSIPITSTVLLLCPELRDLRAIAWLAKTWENDLNAKYQLSYKAAWFLLSASSYSRQLTECTEEYLLSDQRTNGAWGPWRKHPAPDDCFATGIVMWALATQGRSIARLKSLERAIKWTEINRLSNGLFPTHYIEAGSAWLAIGEYFARKVLFG